jgi:hypothetical protein
LRAAHYHPIGPTTDTRASRYEIQAEHSVHVKRNEDAFLLLKRNKSKKKTRKRIDKLFEQSNTRMEEGGPTERNEEAVDKFYKAAVAQISGPEGLTGPDRSELMAHADTVAVDRLASKWLEPSRFVRILHRFGRL